MDSHFISFAAGPFLPVLARIGREAEDSGFFSRITLCTPESLPEEFWRDGMTPEKALHTPRGYWAWRWKPRIILDALLEVPEGGTLTYADAGCTINPAGKERFLQYRERALDLGATVFGLYSPDRDEGRYTRGDVIRGMGAEDLRFTPQIIATAMILSREAVPLVSEWMDLVENWGFAMDIPGREDYPEFVDHRHDQSVFSILCKKRGISPLEDETWSPPYAREQGARKPISATRKRN